MSILQQIACGTAWECKENEDVEAAELADVKDHQAERDLGGDEVLKKQDFFCRFKRASPEVDRGKDWPRKCKRAWERKRCWPRQKVPEKWDLCIYIYMYQRFQVFQKKDLFTSEIRVGSQVSHISLDVNIIYIFDEWSISYWQIFWRFTKSYLGKVSVLTPNCFSSLTWKSIIIGKSYSENFKF